jgi:hypothetical protein
MSLPPQLMVISPQLLAVASALGASLLLSLLSAAGLGSGPPSSFKPSATFVSFYPLYLSQHTLPLTKLLHFLGTLLALGFCLAQPPLLLALGLGALVGFCSAPLFRRFDTGLPEMALMLGTYLASAYTFTHSLAWTLGLPVCAYSFAWVGHFFVERNRPATFIYPTFSLLGDFVMFAEILLGRHAILPGSKQAKERK